MLTVESPSELHNAALAEGLIDLGGTAVQEEGLTLRTFLPAPDSMEPESRDDEAASALAGRAARFLAERAGVDTVQVTWSWQPDEDWLARWRAGLAPRRVGDHFIVAPTWTLAGVTPRPGDVVIAIDPQMAFGTGEHASTRSVLRLMELAVPSGAFVLDVGTGSGILAIAALKLGASAVHAIESDPDAIDNARSNLARNGAAAVRLEYALVDETFLGLRAACYDLILANVQRNVLLPLLPALRSALRSSGTLIIGGILETEAELMRDAGKAAGLQTEAEELEDAWWSARMRGV
jgi:ribosomal protein L11 methyltransferase